MTYKRQLSPAFSLLEILVVIALLAALSLLLVPAMNRVFRSSMQTADMANLRDIWISCNEFSQDNQGFLIMGLDRRNFFGKNPRADKFMSWMDLLKPYLRSASEGIHNPGLISPGDPSKGGAERIGPNKTHRSYGINSRTEWGEIPLNSSVIVRPNIFVIIGNYDISLAGDSANINGGLSGGSNSLDKVPTDWYGNGKANFLFLDGHVEAILVEEIMPGGSRYYLFNRELNRPDNRHQVNSGF